MKEAVTEIVELLEQQPNVEVVAIENVAKELGCNTVYSIYSWLLTLETIKECGYTICKVEGV